MLQRLRNRAQSQEGFTLIELLVVILIIGILAAVAIPTFLSQTNKAYDSNVQASLNTAQNAEATYQTSNGSYTSTMSALTTIEPTLSSAVTNYSLQVPAASVSSSGYTVAATDSKSNLTFTLAYNSGTGNITKTCYSGAYAATPTAAQLTGGANQGACNATNTWGG